jgi:hypothetical protein
MLHNSATPHTARQTQHWFQWYGWEVLQHSALSPDMAPLKLSSLWSLKWHFLEQQFVNDDVIAAVMTCLQALDRDFIVKGFSAPVSCWYKCFNRSGGYVEK